MLHRMELDVHNHIIDFLKSKFIKVDIELIGPAPKDNPGFNVWKKYETKSFCDEVVSKKYDFIISNTHSTTKSLKKFYMAVKNSVKAFIDMEHDLFSAFPERFEKSIVLTFQDKHSSFCKKKEIPHIRCRWPKLDAEVPKTSFKINDVWSEAVFIGTSALNRDIKEGYPLDKRGFNKIWYKKYKNDWDIPLNVENLPDEFIGPLGIKSCMSVFKFLLTINSSCFVEALLMGGLPILLPTNIVSEKKLNEVLSEVKLKNKALGSIKAITVENLEKKIELLKNNNFFESVRSCMLKNWVYEDYFNLPKAYEALYKIIMEVY